MTCPDSKARHILFQNQMLVACSAARLGSSTVIESEHIALEPMSRPAFRKGVTTSGTHWLLKIQMQLSQTKIWFEGDSELRLMSSADDLQNSLLTACQPGLQEALSTSHLQDLQPDRSRRPGPAFTGPHSLPPWKRIRCELGKPRSALTIWAGTGGYSRLLDAQKPRAPDYC